MPYSVVGHREDLEELAQARLSEGRQLVARSEEQLRRTGFQVQTVVEEGDPRSVILDFVSRWGVNLIVRGSHGRTGLDRFLLGSVAESVVRHARCSDDHANRAEQVSNTRHEKEVLFNAKVTSQWRSVRRPRQHGAICELASGSVA